MGLKSLIGRLFTGRAKPLRGRMTLSAAEASALARSVGPTFRVLGVDVPEPLKYRTIMFQGQQGSGKTLSMFDAVLQALKRMRDAGRNERVIILDKKGDITRDVLAARKVFCPHVPVKFLNPFDRFGVAPDPHELTGDPIKITQLVHALTYRKRDARTDDFFDNMGRNHLVALVKILRRKTPGRWGWRDLYHISTNESLHRRVLRASRMGRYKATTKVQKTFAGVVATIEAWLGPYESAIACWDRSPPLALNQYLREPGILVISCPEDQWEAFAPAVRAFVRFIRDRLLSDTGLDERSFTTILLDEFADLEGLVPILLPFFGKSRSAQVSLLLAWQSWAAACQVHGEAEMKSIVDNCGLRFYLQSGPQSVELASEDCLKTEVRRGEWSYAFDGREGAHDPRTATVGYRTELRPNVLPAEIAALGVPGKGNMTVRAFMRGAHLGGPVLCEADYAPLVRLRKALPIVRPVRERGDDDKWVREWDDVADGNRLAPLFVPDPGLSDTTPEDAFAFDAVEGGEL